MIEEFIYKYYIDPILYGYPYTVVDTLTYALVLILAVFLVYRWLKRSGIVIDQGLILATLPYVVLGGLLRVVEDADIVPGWPHYLLITPLIFFLLFVYTVAWLFVSRRCESAGLVEHYSRVYARAGGISCAAVFAILVAHGLLYTRVDLLVPFLILAVGTGTTVWLAGALRFLLKWKFVADPLYLALIFGHMLDAAATSVGIDLHELAYVEQHVVGTALIEATGTAFSMFLLKVAVLVPAVGILQYARDEEGADLWHLIVLAMIVVGLAPGVRDMVRMMIYV